MGEKIIHPKKPNCPECGSDIVVRNGCNRARTCMIQRYQCKVCGRYFREPIVEKFGDQNENGK
jgi:transposase-like protein